MSQDFQCSFTANVSADEAFDKINRVSEWWTMNVDGESKELDDIFKIEFGKTWSTMKIVESVPGKKVVWYVTDCFLHFLKDKQEWKGTKIVFEIFPKKDSSEIVFTHLGLVPEIECYGNCQEGWNFYAGTSLRKLMNEGKGTPDSIDHNKKKNEISRRAPRAIADTKKGVILATADLVLSPERVFRALTKKEEIENWWGSNDTYHMRDWNADFRVGGSYTVTVKNHDGSERPASGKFLELDRPQKIVHTRKYDWDFPVLGRRETTITYLLDPIDIGTRITVRHEGFSGCVDAANQHADGWERVLGWLDRYLFYNYYFPKEVVEAVA